MGFINRFRVPREDAPGRRAFEVLTFAPAVIRMSVSGKDTTKELDALASAVEKLGFPQGFSAERVFATASEMARLVNVEGIAGVTDRMKTDLAPEVKNDALRLALVAVLNSPVRDSGDIGFLGRMAAQIGVSKAEFDALHAQAAAMA